MSELSRREVARRAGVDEGYVGRLIELGIVSAEASLSTGDVRRAQWTRNLERAGIPLDDLAAAVRSGRLSFDFLDASAFDRFSVMSDTTFRELGERTGIPLDLLKVVREAIGFAEPRPEDRVREDELAVVPVIELQLGSGFDPAVIARWLRMLGDSLRRVAETETSGWRTQIIQPLQREGIDEPEMLERQADVGSRMAPLVEAALLAVYRGQQEHAWSRGAFELVEETLDEAGLYSRLERPPAMSFLDITGYTQLTEERGDEAAADLAERLGTLVRRSSTRHGGQPVKWLGDGVMCYFPDPAQAVLAALEMVEGVADRGLPPAHVGIHAGPVIFQGGDYFGRTVNIASRLADRARPGEVLVTQEVVNASGGASVTFTEIGPVELKGVSRPLRLHAASRAA